MDIARVIGNIVATRKDTAFKGVTILVIQPLDEELQPAGDPLVATDSLGIRGPGELVFFVTGGDAVHTGTDKRPMPVDAAVMGIVDDIHYKKSYLP